MLKRIVKGIVSSTLWGLLLWAAMSGSTFATWLVVAFVWFTLMACIWCVNSEDMQRKVTAEWKINPPIPMFFNIIWDSAILVLFFRNNWIITGVVYALATFLGLYFRFTLMENTSDVKSDKVS